LSIKKEKMGQCFFQNTFAEQIKTEEELNPYHPGWVAVSAGRGSTANRNFHA
jgi:hypothetical protein